MATKVTVTIKKDTREVKFNGGLEELLLAIVKSFDGVLTSVDDIDILNLMVYDDEEEEYVPLKKPYPSTVQNGTRLKVFLKKAGTTAESAWKVSYGSAEGVERFKSLGLELLAQLRADRLLESPWTTSLACDVEQLSETECQERIKRFQEKAERLIEAAQKINVCFLLDCTGSMLPWITEIKDNIHTWKIRLLECYPNAHLHFAFVRYTDFDQPENTRTSFIDFTEDADAFSAFIEGIEIEDGVGDDEAEDVFGGLKVAIEDLSWCSSDGTKVLIHIADAPCHGLEYHDSSVGDSHPDGDPSNNPTELLEKLHSKQIQYYFGYITKQATDKMISEFNGILFSLSEESNYIKQLDATNPESVNELVFNSLNESITKTLSSFNHISKELIVLDSSIPKWDAVKGEKAIITPHVRSDLTENEILQHVCLPSVVATIKRGTQPFAMGSCRYVYHGYIVDTLTHVVLKENKGDTNIKRYLENYHAHLTALVYAEQFNKEKPVTAESIQFVSPSVLQIKEGSKWRHFFVELYIDGVYQKFNSNAGYVAQSSKINDVLQAFSHYTWQKSGKRFIVCDLQGIVTESGVLLTDPSIHSQNKQLLRYGSTNLGSKGIETFFGTHTCSIVCREMKLQPYQ